MSLFALGSFKLQESTTMQPLVDRALGVFSSCSNCFGTHETIGVRDEHLITKQF